MVLEELKGLGGKLRDHLGKGSFSSSVSLCCVSVLLSMKRGMVSPEIYRLFGGRKKFRVSSLWDGPGIYILYMGYFVSTTWWLINTNCES